MRTPREEAHGVRGLCGNSAGTGRHTATCDRVTRAIEIARADGVFAVMRAQREVAGEGVRGRAMAVAFVELGVAISIQTARS